jgi:hypothetical protein
MAALDRPTTSLRRAPVVFRDDFHVTLRHDGRDAAQLSFDM